MVGLIRFQIEIYKSRVAALVPLATWLALENPRKTIDYIDLGNKGFSRLMSLIASEV